MSEITQFGEVPKTEKEKRLNLIYMGWLKHSKIIKKSIVTSFKKDVEEIRIENPFYNKKQN
jgi:hypothetical protein